MAEATTQAPAGTFCWNELMTRDVPAARNFYTKLLGWTTEEMNMGEMGTYTIFKQGETQIGGLMAMPPNAGDAPPHWMTYIAVDNVDASTKKAQDLGAKACVQPTDIPNIGRFSVITDPTGATIALFQGK